MTALQVLAAAAVSAAGLGGLTLRARRRCVQNSKIKIVMTDNAMAVRSILLKIWRHFIGSVIIHICSVSRVTASTACQANEFCRTTQ